MLGTIFMLLPVLAAAVLFAGGRSEPRVRRGVGIAFLVEAAYGAFVVLFAVVTERGSTGIYWAAISLIALASLFFAWLARRLLGSTRPASQR